MTNEEGRERNEKIFNPYSSLFLLHFLKNSTVQQFYFETTSVYKNAKELTPKIYHLTAQYPKHELFALVSQIRRAMISVGSNIAEGFSRQSGKEQARFTEIAFGSLMEVLCQLNLSLDLDYIKETEYSEIRPLIEQLANQLSALRKTQLNR